MCHTVACAGWNTQQSTGRHNQYSSTINLMAQSTLQQDPHPSSQQAGTINTLLAQSTLRHHHQSGPVNTPAQSTLRHNQRSGTIKPPAQSNLRHNQPSGTGNIPAESTLQHNQQFGTITILAQHCGRVSPAAQSTVWHNHHSGTVNIPAQSTIRHHHHCGTHCWKHPDMPLHNSMIDAVNYGTYVIASCCTGTQWFLAAVVDCYQCQQSWNYEDHGR